MEHHTNNQQTMRKCKSPKCGKHVYITIGKSKEYTPAFICEINNSTAIIAVTDGVIFTNRIGDKLSPIIKIPFNGQNTAAPDGEIEIYESASMEIDTPDGTLIIEDKLDDEYPGVWVSVQNKKGKTTLSLVEYITGGEGICDYMPGHKEEMERQRKEVPLQRLQQDKNGTPTVTKGLVTRAWPCDNKDDEFHYRNFHYGY